MIPDPKQMAFAEQRWHGSEEDLGSLQASVSRTSPYYCLFTDQLSEGLITPLFWGTVREQKGAVL